MINVQDVLRDVPHFETFCSVKRLHELVGCLRADSRFEIHVAGASVQGVPIHHVRFGSGAVKAMFVAGVHAPEPVGSLTVFSLLTLLSQRNKELSDANVEWHVVPCIDPDGALLNEGWSQEPFTIEKHVRNFYLQECRDQVDMSFPITYKKLVFNQQSSEGKVLQGLLEQIRPDFYFSLHNTLVGGGFYYLTRDIGQKYYQEIHKLLRQLNVPSQKRPPWSQFCAQFFEGIVELFSMKKYYDYLEQVTPSPEKFLKGYGEASAIFLTEMKPSALAFVAETGLVRHPDDESEKETGQNLRQFKLRVDADSKFLASVMVEEWEKVKEDVDCTSPFYRAVVGLALPAKEAICEGGLPISRDPTREILFDPKNNRMMTEGDRFSACIAINGFAFLPFHYQFVRLLKASRQTPAVQQATERLERVFEEALNESKRHVDFNAFEVISCDTLAKAQLGSGLIVINSILEAVGDSATV